jgi:hypothetical protein
LVRCAYDNSVCTVATSHGFDGFGERLGAVNGDEVLGAAVKDEVLFAGVVDTDYAVADTASAILNLTMCKT